MKYLVAFGDGSRQRVGMDLENGKIVTAIGL